VPGKSLTVSEVPPIGHVLSFHSERLTTLQTVNLKRNFKIRDTILSYLCERGRGESGATAGNSNISCRSGGDAPDLGRLKGARNGQKKHIG
jgi:hypothetical protein